MMSEINLIELSYIGEESKEPKYEPRKPRFRTITQWVCYIFYKAGYLKREDRCYACEFCGAYADDNWPSSTLLYMSKPQYSHYASYEFGITGHDWEEEHQCDRCGSLFGYSNSSY